jgi:uncharacterized coiled-coil DUF342 family protein
VTDREFRLRLRIDRLQDERDEALEKLASTRSQRDRYRQRSHLLKKQLATWKAKAIVPATQTCTVCHLSKRIDQFERYATTFGVRPRSTCRACRQQMRAK